MSTVLITVCHTCGFVQEVDKRYSQEWPISCGEWMDRIYWSVDHTLFCPDFEEKVSTGLQELEDDVELYEIYS